MQYCPISLLLSLPAVASDSTSGWEITSCIFTIAGLIPSIMAICIAKKAFYRQMKDGKSADHSTKKALKKQDEMITEQKILGAWSLLAQKGTGDLGRKDALEFLHKQGKSLAGLDLSNAHLVGLKLNGADLTGCNFTGANLTDAEFVECKFDNSLRDARSDFHWIFNKCEFDCKNAKWDCDILEDHLSFPEHFKHITFTECKFPNWHFNCASQALMTFITAN